MTTTTTALEPVTDDVFSDIELRTLAGFLGGYSGLTRDAYALDLRQFAQWCHDRHIALFAVVRGDIEAFARNLEDRDRPRPQRSRGNTRCRRTRRRPRSLLRLAARSTRATRSGRVPSIDRRSPQRPGCFPPLGLYLRHQRARDRGRRRYHLGSRGRRRDRACVDDRPVREAKLAREEVPDLASCAGVTRCPNRPPGQSDECRLPVIGGTTMPQTATCKRCQATDTTPRRTQ